MEKVGEELVWRRRNICRYLTLAIIRGTQCIASNVSLPYRPIHSWAAANEAGAMRTLSSQVTIMELNLKTGHAACNTNPL